MTDSSTSWLQQQRREWRHNPCLMSPVAMLLLITVSFVWFIGMVFKFPSVLLGFLLRPVLTRFNFVVEFLYPTELGRWIHFFVVRIVQSSRHAEPNDKNKGTHSRFLETRVEVVQGRVYIHPLPQLLDNLGYLVVCKPEGAVAADQANSTNTPLGKITVAQEEQESGIVAFVVDCGDAVAVARQIDLIRDLYYAKQPISVQSILSTHKHHDHTAGNKGLLGDPTYGDSIERVIGGAVEKVPFCNYPVCNGEMLPLPRWGVNDMMDVIQVEAIATPAHTRGSVTYALRPTDRYKKRAFGSAFFFTGDTMFSAGGGVPFEADVDNSGNDNKKTVTANTFINASAASHAVERCFAEVLYRSVGSHPLTETCAHDLFVMPGHEYTAELLSRQMTQTSNENCKWKNFAPSDFFETVSQLYVAMHRRTLPHSSGKLLNTPSPISRELQINPHFRSLRKRGETIIHALNIWNTHFSSEKVSDEIVGAYGLPLSSPSLDYGNTLSKSSASPKRWNLDGNDIRRPVFTTVYAEEFDRIVEDLGAGRITSAVGARRLRELKSMLDVPPVVRRPIPGTLPADRAMYRGLLALALLGSSPTALSLSDSRVMKLPPPVAQNSDKIQVSKRRLVTVLYLLGLLTEENEGKRVVAIIDQLWRETVEYLDKIAASKKPAPARCDVSTTSQHSSVGDFEGRGEALDQLDLGALKWMLYGVPSLKPSWFPKFCTPCSRPATSHDRHPRADLQLEQHRAELVRHDVFTCYLCKSATGCPLADAEELVNTADRPTLRRIGSTRSYSEGNGGGDFIEVSMGALGSAMPEAS